MASQFVFGGLGGMSATAIVQPIDLIKTRMQLAGEGTAGRIQGLPFVRNLLQTEGFFSLYAGMSAAMLRQMTYTTTRFGTFQVLKRKLATPGEGPLPLWKKAVAGLGAGAAGAVVGTPAEVAMVRMQADGRMPVAERRGYKNVADALIRVTREEGITTLWRGCGPTVGRAMLLNCAQLASYDQVKGMLIASGYFRDNIGAHAMASTFSGLLATIVSMPMDIAKTRLQNMKPASPGAPAPYKGTADVLLKTVRAEGALSLWKGFVPYYLRLGQHTIYAFLFFEFYNTLYDDYRYGGSIE